MSNESEKMKKKFDEFQENVKKHMSEARQADKKRVDELESRLKALEEKVKKK
jgi:polyhydroxyalkanoate synthesis regulator phasin